MSTKGKVDISTITESNLGSSFTATQFLIDGYQNHSGLIEIKTPLVFFCMSGKI